MALSVLLIEVVTAHGTPRVCSSRGILLNMLQVVALSGLVFHFVTMLWWVSGFIKGRVNEQIKITYF